MLAVMALSFAVNYLLLRGTQQLSTDYGRIGSLLTASLLGAAYAGACMLPSFSFLGKLHWRIVSLILMSVLAFGWEPAAWKQGGVFLLMTMALGGTALSAGRGEGWPLIIYAVGIRLLSRYAFGTARRMLPVQITGRGRTVQLTALMDTGNELRDPITGERVLVVDEKTAQKLTGLTHAQLQNPLATAASGVLPGLRLIPYQAVGAESGMLLGMRFPSVRIAGRDRKGIVAFAPQQLGGEAYQALAGGIV